MVIRGGVEKLETQIVHYLNANLFYSQNLNYRVKKNLITFCKAFLYPHLLGLPKLTKAHLHIVYVAPTDTWDLDNKGFFWRKLILDILKTPTAHARREARRKQQTLWSTETLPEDTVRYVPYCTEKYEHGPHALRIIIEGELAAEQKKLL